MAILLDPPRWPAHGTTFSHLVSDSSTAELHAFAARAGLDRRAFDVDHYDVPARRHAELVALGARPVSGSELVRRLRGSGLRVPASRRPERVRRVLRRRWEELLPGVPEIGEGLLARWSEDHRQYHDVTHLLAVLTALEALTRPDPVPRVVVLAAWFHDAVYDGAGDDEQRSAALARRLLAGHVDAREVEEVARLVLLTRTHRPGEDDAPGSLLCDADLAVLGDDVAGYARYVEAVRADYAHVTDDAWRTGRAAVLRDLLALDPLFRTTRGQQCWEAAARRNLQGELDHLER